MIRSRTRCLIFDNELAPLEPLCAALEEHGYAIHRTSRSEQALKCLHAGKNDLLLVNMALQTLGSIEFCSAAYEIDPALGMIVITDDAKNDIPRAVLSGIFHFLIQPFQIDSAIAIIEHTLESGRIRRSLMQFQETASRQREQLAQFARDSEASLGHISHDLRAPPRTIDGFAQILQEDFDKVLGYEGQRFLQVIRAETQKMDEMIVGLLDSVRAGVRLLERDPVDMTALARSVADEVLLQQAGSRAKINIDPLPSVYADQSAMRQVWFNLIANAVQFSARSDQPRIIVRGQVEGNDIVYQIEDNGVGFDMRHVDRIFGIFGRLHRSDEFAGRGIGLAVAKRLIVRHGGQIRARGSMQGGACFEFVMPGEESRDEIQAVGYL